jgi:hypothetical protein
VKKKRKSYIFLRKMNQNKNFQVLEHPPGGSSSYVIFILSICRRIKTLLTIKIKLEFRLFSLNAIYGKSKQTLAYPDVKQCQNNNLKPCQLKPLFINGQF